MRILDLGCGHVKLPGAVGLDISPETDADVVHDLNDVPWPFAAGEFDFVNCQDVIEHVEDVVRTMEEIHRVTKPGGRVHIRVPHFSSVQAYTDITHKHFFSTDSFEYFTANALYPHYSAARFEVKSRRLVHWKPYRWLGIASLANRFRLRYEKMFAFTFPAQFIEFELRRVP